MRKQLFFLTFILAIVLAFSLERGDVAAKSKQPGNPAQTVAHSALDEVQIFSLTTSSEAAYSNPSGALQPMPSTSLTIQTQSPRLFTISFSARGTVAPSGSQIIPIVFIECQIDGQACQPNTNPVEFLYPQFCCDTRSFHWAVENVPAGSHTVQILWGMGNPTSAFVSNRSLIVETAKL